MWLGQGLGVGGERGQSWVLQDFQVGYLAIVVFSEIENRRGEASPFFMYNL